MDEPVTKGAVVPAAARLAAPRWTDSRLLLGVLLVLASVVLTSRLVASAEQEHPVWRAAHDLPAGTVLRADDLVRADVRLDEVGAGYLAVAASSPLGRVVGRPVRAGELVPVSALQPASASATAHLVSVPVEALHYPPGLGRGDLVDVYVVPGAQSGAGTGRAVPGADPQRVLASAAVVEVDADQGRLGGVGASAAVVLAVDDADVPGLVAAVRSGAVDLVLVPAP